MDAPRGLKKHTKGKCRVEKTQRFKHNDFRSCLKQNLESTPHKPTTLQPFIHIQHTVQVRQTRDAEYYGESKDKLIRDILRWNPNHGYFSVDWRAE